MEEGQHMTCLFLGTLFFLFLFRSSLNDFLWSRFGIFNWFFNSLFFFYRLIFFCFYFFGFDFLGLGFFLLFLDGFLRSFFFLIILISGGGGCDGIFIFLWLFDFVFSF